MWWLRPSWAIVVIVVPTAIGAFLIPYQDFLTNWGTPKYFDAPALATVLAAAVALALPWVVIQKLWPSHGASGVWGESLDSREEALALRAYSALMLLTLFGYGTWAYLGASRGVNATELSALFSDQSTSYALRATLSTVTGLTTFTQFGLAAAGLGTFLYLRTRRPALRLGVVLLVLLAAARALVYSERLALIEIGTVVIVVMINYYTTHREPGAMRRAAFVPVVLVPIIFLIFAGFESTRSYQFYSSQSAQLNLVTFSAERIEGYYATSYNNGVIAQKGFWLSGEAHIPYFSLGFVWDFPLLKGRAYPSLTGIDPNTRWPGVLSLYANPEFNNPGGISSALADFGAPLGLVFLACTGCLLAFVFRLFTRGDPIGLLMYPILFVGIADLPREPYWGSGRAFPSLVAAILVGYLWRHRRRLYQQPVGDPYPISRRRLPVRGARSA